MDHNTRILCPACNDKNLVLKYEATYEYSYVIDADAPGHCNEQELLPYLYDNRKQTASKQYIECRTCGTQYPLYFDNWPKGIDTVIIQNALSPTHLSK